MTLNGVVAAAPRTTEAGLSATLVGRLEPGEQGRLAVRWHGSAGQLLDVWVDLDGGLYSLAVYDDGSGLALYAGGTFTTAGGVTVNRIARWDGGSWTALSGPEGTGTNGTVLAFAGFDDGSGAALYAGGNFTAAGGLPSSHIAVWQCPTEVFADGFEDGGAAAWSLTVP